MVQFLPGSLLNLLVIRKDGHQNPFEKEANVFFLEMACIKAIYKFKSQKFPILDFQTNRRPELFNYFKARHIS